MSEIDPIAERIREVTSRLKHARRVMLRQVSTLRREIEGAKRVVAISTDSRDELKRRISHAVIELLRTEKITTSIVGSGH